MSLDQDFLALLAWIAAGTHVLGVLSAVRAVMGVRSSQGAIAWAISLLTFPYVAVPLFWVFGRDRFRGYVPVEGLRKGGGATVLERLAGMPFTSGNRAGLLIDGRATFDALFEGIDSAREYLLVQFFIVHDDELGRAFREKLVAAARRGVKVYFLFDEIGSRGLRGSYLKPLREAGVEARAFKTNQGPKNRFQINFRNHRKIVVVDGRTAFVGGHNVGDEYLGKSRRFGRWRDTHVRVEGPVVGQVQVSFCEDWHWSSGKTPTGLRWDCPPGEGGLGALALPTGPADGLDTCGLFFLQALYSAKKRIWITSPYFVPDRQTLSALQLAVLRGVDVRILLPSVMDHVFVYLASFSYLKDTIPHGLKLFRFRDGFLHQKVMLVDDELAAVGTANFDNRSFRLNFEITLVFADRGFNGEVEAMLREDFRLATPVSLEELTGRSLPFRIAVQVSRLMAPVL